MLNEAKDDILASGIYYDDKSKIIFDDIIDKNVDDLYAFARFAAWCKFRKDWDILVDDRLERLVNKMLDDLDEEFKGIGIED